MSRFYVGQRVRIIGSYAPEYSYMIGMEAVVDDLDIEDEFGAEGCVGVTVDGDSEWCFLPEELEPITDSYDKVEWSECLWRPTHEEVSA